MSQAYKLPDSQYSFDALTELGVAPERCSLVPHGFSPEVLTVEGQDDRFRRYGTVFLAIVNSNDVYRMGSDLLLQAYDRAFTAADEVVLVLKDYSMADDTSLLAQWLRQRRGGPRVIHLREFMDKDALVRLYRGADFCVAPFRGEGFGVKLLDAAAAGTPILAPAYGGPVDFLQPGSFFPLAYRTVPVGDCLDRTVGIVPAFAEWIEVEVDDLARQFREVRRDRGEALRRARLAQDFVRGNFSWKNAALRLWDALERFGRERGAIIDGRRFQGPAPKKLSVLMATYNRQDTLGRCLDAYRQQTLDPQQWELLLIDDHSNYPVADFVAQRGAGLPIRLMVNETNRGQGQCRNRALPETRGETVLFTGDDIIPEKTFLEEHVRAHQAHNNAEQLAVLGHIYWHPEVPITPLMAYTTGEGGQQFYYDSLKPGQWVHHNYFYTSNVSVRRSLLMEQEEWFNPRFVCYGYEDVELAARLARAGMHMVYHPKARAGHLHALTDQNIYDRQYKIGRMTVVYLMLHAEICPAEHLVFIQWLDIAQHLLLHDPAFLEVRDDLAQFSQAFCTWFESLCSITARLAVALNPDRCEHGKFGPLFRHEGAQRLWLTKTLYAYRLNLALRTGMADEWMGVKAGEPNPARDLLHALLCTSYWGLFRPEAAPAPFFPPPTPAAGRMLRLARQLRHHPLLAPLWGRVRQLPGFRKLKGATKRMLHAMP
jgi:glycosyltransferase involved in cell wall biosynthesis